MVGAASGAEADLTASRGWHADRSQGSRIGMVSRSRVCSRLSPTWAHGTLPSGEQPSECGAPATPGRFLSGCSCGLGSGSFRREVADSDQTRLTPKWERMQRISCPVVRQEDVSMDELEAPGPQPWQRID